MAATLSAGGVSGAIPAARHAFIARRVASSANAPQTTKPTCHLRAGGGVGASQLTRSLARVVTTPLSTARLLCTTASMPTSSPRCRVHATRGSGGRVLEGRASRRAVPRAARDRQLRCKATSLSSIPPPRQEEDRLNDNLPGLAWVETVCDTLAAYYWLWIIVGTAVALTTPAVFAGMTPASYSMGLFCIMMSMGFTITLQDFQEALRDPAPVLTGMALQYTIMPTCGFLVGKALGLPPALAVGLILVSCCPGGAASNVVTHVARGNVTLSVVLTTCSTVMACVLTPLLVMFLAGSLVPINGAALGADVLKVVLLPVTAGMLLAEMMPRNTKRYLTCIMPAAAVVTSTCLTSGALASCAPLIVGSMALAAPPLLAVVLTHGLGFLLGYQLCKRLGFEPKVNRTVSIEVGMQSSVMALALATKHFADVSSQLPCALSAVVMNVMGAGLAFFFRWRARQKHDSR